MILLALLLAAPQAATPIGDPSTWITTDDYPAEALRADQAGITVVRYDISATGQIENCSAAQSSGSAALDAAACAALAARGRFNPATDSRGRPIRSSATRRIRWQIPEETPVRIGHVFFERGANGRIANCVARDDAGAVGLVDSFCEALTASGPGQPLVQSGVLTIPMPDLADSGEQEPEIGRLTFTRGANGRIASCAAQATGGRTARLDNGFCEALTTVGPGEPPVQSGAMTVAMPDGG